MRSAIVALLLALIAALAAVPAAAAAPQPIAFDPTGSQENLTCTIDHQGTYPGGDPLGFVHNPTACVDPGHPPLPLDQCGWGDQDGNDRVSVGYVEGTWTDRTCLFADEDDDGFGNMPKGVYVKVYAPSNTLAVELSNNAGSIAGVCNLMPCGTQPADDRWVIGPPVKSGNNWLWEFCVEDAVADRGNVRSQHNYADYWPLVPFSNSSAAPPENGGHAQRVDYTLKLTSLTSRTRNVTAHFEVAGTGPSWQAPRVIKTCNTH